MPAGNPLWSMYLLFDYFYSYTFSLLNTIAFLELLSVLVLARTMLKARAPRQPVQEKPRRRFAVDCVTALYLVSRVVILLRLAVHTGHKTDVNFYHSVALQWLSGEIPYRDFQFQYPPLSLLLIGLPKIIQEFVGQFSPLSYNMYYRLLMFVLDAVTYRLVRREAERRGRLEFVIYHIATSSIFAFILFDRLDVALALTGFYAAARMSDAKKVFRSAFAIGLGTLVKLTPICLLPVLIFEQLAARGSLRSIFKITALTLAPVVVGFLLVSLISPRSNLPFIAYHKVRGIEVESTWSSLIMAAHFMRVGWFENLSVQLNSSSQSSDLMGSECDQLAGIINWIMAAFLTACLIVMYRCRGCRMQNRPIFMGTFILVSFIISSKVLSPQYLIWLTPLAPFAFAELSGLSRIAAFAGFFIASFLTTVIFPVQMGDLVALRPGPAAILAIRNGLIVFIWLLMALRLMKGLSGAVPEAAK